MVTSTPSSRAEAATSAPIHPDPTTTSDDALPRRSRSPSLSCTLRRASTPSRSLAETGMELGRAPVASSSRS